MAQAAARQHRKPKERTRPVAVLRGPARHAVACPRCSTRFDLFAAAWCRCTGEHPSKVCHSCGHCACSQPGYSDPRLWAKAPPLFVQHGFEKLFVAYL